MPTHCLACCRMTDDRCARISVHNTCAVPVLAQGKREWEMAHTCQVELARIESISAQSSGRRSAQNLMH